MKLYSLSAVALTLCTLSFGCAAPPPDEISVAASSAEALTLAECAAQQDRCFSKNTILGLLTCPAQYATCVATASNGLPAQVTAAITDARDCAADARDCLERSRNAAQAAVCAEDEAQCVAAIVGAELPDIVEGTVECVDGTIDCIQDAQRATDLRACGETFEDCAIEQVQSVLPEGVGQVVGDIARCTQNSADCIQAAESASDLTTCAEEQAQCVADSLGVTLPDVPLTEVVSCAEDAADCGRDASSVSDVTACADDLRECAADVVEGVDLPPVLTCDQEFTACLTRNPLNFLGCALDLTGCRD